MSKITVQQDNKLESSTLSKNQNQPSREKFETSVKLTDDDEECASFLLTLKHQVSPNLKEEIEEINRSPLLCHSFRQVDDEEKYGNNSFDHSKKECNGGSYSSKIESNRYNYETMEELLGESDLFAPEDFVLVPDYIFYAMSQMKMCHVEEVDRVGCYKTRPLGFAGMCCKHCGGRPGSGKYFPATIRGLAQTTTTHTIIKHVESKCRRCPANVRQRLLDMQTNSTGGNYGRSDKVSADYTSSSSKQDLSDSTGPNKPKYGSRKVFFERLWGRLHNEEIPEISKEAFPGQEADSEHEEDDGNSDEDKNEEKQREIDMSSSEDNEPFSSLQYMSRNKKSKRKYDKIMPSSLSNGEKEEKDIRLFDHKILDTKKKKNSSEGKNNVFNSNSTIKSTEQLFLDHQPNDNLTKNMKEKKSKLVSEQESKGRKRKPPKFYHDL